MYRVYLEDGSQWVRLINLGGDRARVMKPFDTDWSCDPCSPPAKRYTVRHPAGDLCHAWYEVITNDDSARDRWAKWQQAQRVIDARRVLRLAEQAYRKETNG